jgi:hypothetical protein
MTHAARGALGARVIAFVLVVATAAGTFRLRSALLARSAKLQERTDVYELPSPDEVVVLSLGYRSAVADFLFAHVLVWHGIHFEQKRRLEFAADYLDTISALDPTFRETYYYGDTLITAQPVPPRHEDYVRARRLLERGLKVRPTDTDLWLSAGQYIAYVAAPWLDDPMEKAEWKLVGARILARACELVGSNENIPYNCISAAGLFSRAGERAANIDFLERVLAVSDDEALRERTLGLLERALGERSLETLRARQNLLREAWRADLPFVDLTTELVLGPPTNPAACAGLNLPTVACATTWADWRARERAARPAP